MAQKITKNTFEGGLNTDLDPLKTSINQYLEAHNVEIVSDGKFFALENIQGTTNVKDITGDNGVECLRCYRVKFLIDGESKESLLIFTVTPAVKFKIWAYEINGGNLYELFEEPVDSEYLTDDRVIDAINYPENGVDIVYFTDNNKELRKLRCEIPTPYAANFINAQQLSLQKRGAVGHIDLGSVSSGGSLLSGTYQFVYRMAEPTTKTFSKWSTPGNPIHVYDKAPSSGAIVNSGIGLPTSFKIILNVYPSQEELDNYGYFQIGVIENILSTAQETVSLLSITETSGRLNYQYTTNDRIGTTTLEDVVVDLAAIETVKTLNISRNRLFAGNVKYKSLVFDNGTPTVVSGTISRRTYPQYNPFSNHEFSSQFIGYFRDEVYRFGIVCEDEFGNKTPVKTLNMSNVVGNQITPGVIDMKFPSRSTSNLYTLFNSDNKIQSLGLNLLVNNIPSTARKIHIVRVKRKKNILFQTPIIPMVSVTGSGAIENYPNTVEYDNGVGLVQKTYPDAQPMTFSTVLIPKNMLWPEARSIVRRTQKSGTGLNTSLINEVYQARLSSYNNATIFPSQTLYGGSSFDFLGNEKFSFVDYVFLKADIRDYSPSLTPAIVNGDHANTNVSATLYGLSDNQYYFDNTFTGKSINIKDIPIVDYESVDTASEGVTLSGKSAVRYEDLNTKGLDFGFKPDNQKMGLINWSVNLTDPIYSSLVFKVGSCNGFSAGGFISGASGPRFETANLTNAYVSTYSGYVNKSSLVSVVPIANVTSGQTDYRYGSEDTEYEFIATGASKTLTPSEIAAVQSGSNPIFSFEVFGGDCFTGVHTFKVSDSTYSVTNQGKNNNDTDTQAEMAKKWANVFFTHTGVYGGDTRIPMCLPYALENVGQFVQVVLEAEYNGDVLDYDILTEDGNVNGIPIKVASTADKVRVPLTYSYNTNLSKQNDQKVYFPKPRFGFDQYYYGARVVYSELKIYNSSEQGFDTFKVLNFLDLEEKRYSITKLALAGDDLYGIQQRGIVYLPTSQNQLEQTDAGSLAVGTSDVIGRPIIVDSERGSQHLKGIVESGQLIYIPDNINKAVYILSGQQLKNISDENVASTFRQIFANPIIERDIIGVYDPVRKQYWMVDNAGYTCYRFNESAGFWVSNLEFSEDNKLHGSTYNDQELFLIGQGSTSGNEQLAIHTMYTGVLNQLFGTEVVPRVTVSINPDVDFSKVFDNVMVTATDRLDSVDMVVERESTMGNQVVNGMNLDTNSIEGNFRIKALLDNNNSRIRGLNVLGTFKWGSLKSAFSSIITKYRFSARSPF